jgi:hypothetical protein
LLNKNQRRQFLKNCYNQLSAGGVMVFITVSKGYQKLIESGKAIGKDRFRLDNGLKVFFYDPDSIVKEFGKLGLSEFTEIKEGVKHMPDEEPMKFWMVVCTKS